MNDYKHELSTVARIQDAILDALAMTKLDRQALRAAVKQPRTRSEPKENWDAQFELALTGLLIREKIAKQRNLITINRR